MPNPGTSARKALLLAAAFFLVAAPFAPIAPTLTTARAEPAPLADLVRDVEIPYSAFTLANGLRVLVHTDRKAPLVSVGVWYDVGSVDEPVGKSGFAHLFEHLMFYGSEHVAGNLFTPLESVGATDFNGTTDFDRTNYFETVPTPALELALFLESDRMGFLLPALDQQKLDAQRNVVLNEKRQGDNQPGGLVRYKMLQELFPPDNPMAVAPIGSKADLDGATLADARQWFHTHYGPNNAVLVLAGDIDEDQARPLVQKWFGEIPPGPTPGRFRIDVPRHQETRRATMTDSVATTRLTRFWAIPGNDNDKELVPLTIAVAILASGPTSRLYEELVRKEGVAVAVGGGADGNRHAGVASLSVELAPGADPAAVEKRIDAVLAAFLRDGPTADEVARVAMRAASGTIRGLEKVGGLGGKGAALAEGLLDTGNPAAYRDDLQRFAEATPATVRAAAQTWLARGDFRLTLKPGPRNPAAIPAAPETRIVKSAEQPPRPFTPGPAAPRDAMPQAGLATELKLPPIEHATLANGLKLTFARTAAVPVVRVLLSFPGGITADSREKPGTEAMMLGMLDEGSDGRLGPLDGPEIARRAERLGASIGASQALDRTRFSLGALSVNLGDSLELFADVVRHPSFPEEQLARVRVQAETALKREQASPNGLAIRALPALVYGPDHPYGRSFSGSGTEEGLQSVTRDDLVRFHARLLHPEDAELFVVGDTTLAEVKPLLERAFGDWKGSPEGAASAPPAAPIAKVAKAVGAGRIALIDRPGAVQSIIVAAAPLPLAGGDDILALSLANDVFGGLSSGRLNQDLREQKNWSYGAYSSVLPTKGQMPFILSAPVETSATGDSMAAILALLGDFEGKAPPTAAEIKLAKENLIRSLPGDFETSGALVAALERQANLGRPDDYLERLPQKTEALSAQAIATAPLPKPADLVFVVVGDKAKILPQLAKLGWPIDEQPALAPPDAQP